jgi:putative Holliday junction resolvase
MSHEPGRAMALDVGSRRIGVALSDTLRLIASPLTTLRATPRTYALQNIAALIATHEVCDLVVGHPVSLNGTVGPQAKLIEAFVEELRPLVQVPITLVDERLTSVAADRMMQDMGIRPDQRRARIDEMAASIILQDFLDGWRNRTGRMEFAPP